MIEEGAQDIFASTDVTIGLHVLNHTNYGNYNIQ